MANSQWQSFVPLKSEIMELYTNQKLGAKAVGERIGTSRDIVRTLLRKFGIKQHLSKVERFKELMNKSVEMKRLYLIDRKSLREIAGLFGTEKAIISKILKLNGIEIRKAKDQRYEVYCKHCDSYIGIRKKPVGTCRSCFSAINKNYAFINYRKASGYNVTDTPKCLKCNVEMPDKYINRQYCDFCKSIRQKEIKKICRLRNVEHHRAKSREYNTRRRCRLYGIEALSLPEETRNRVFEIYGYQCMYCGKMPRKITVDHVLALANRGDNAITNLVPACKSCNSSKRDNYLLNWMWKRLKKHKPMGAIDL